MPSPARAYRPESDPRFTEAMRLQVAGRLPEALERYRAILKEAPESAELHHALGALHLQLNEAESSLSHFEEAVRLAPGNPRYVTHLAHAQKSAGRLKEAVQTLTPLVEANSQDRKLFTDYFNLCVTAEEFTPLAAQVEKRHEENPDDPLFRSLLIFAYERLGKYVATLPHLRFLYTRDPNQQAVFFINYVKALRMDRQLSEADAMLAEGLRRHPNSQELTALEGGRLLIRGQFEAAHEVYTRAHAMDPSSAHIRASLGIVKMLLSDLREGYEEYSARTNLDTAMNRLAAYYTKWSGQPLAGKKLMLWTEQGIGDIIMFTGLLPWLIAQGPQITCVVMGKLIPLLERAFPEVKFVPTLHVVQHNSDGAAPFDYHLPMGELMQAALPHRTPAEHPPYLKADAARIETLRTRYRALMEKRGAKKLIGISWFTQNDDTAYFRNIPLREWNTLFSLPHVQWVSLQYGDHAAEIEAANRHHPGALFVDPEIDAMDDIDGLAAQMCAMDEIISIQNATVHLAGALGVPATILLNASSDWRWGLGSSNHWYRSVTLARQQTVLEWEPLMQTQAERLK